ncbi:MAG: radical SAM family heme chaperone HemW [Bacteroidales bacterium]|nr:radical SAM family heme chaperone HemW [Bacteroidales bacterium]
MAGIYLHIPFCASFCTYCGFYSEVCTGREPHARYIEALARETSLRRDFFKGEPIKTIYFGGGTPSMLMGDDLHRIHDALAAAFDLSRVEEFTVEVNPEDVVSRGGLLPALRSIGANRISMGVQSFCDRHLRWMNRRHDAATAVEAFRKLRTAGFGNISIDLIFGFAGLTDIEWRDTLQRAISLAPEHISAYQMSIDAESALAEMVALGRYADPGDEICARQYELQQQMLEAAGYGQYEVSNFCRPGYHSRHNSAYWTREPYLGLGAAAHSFNGSDRRSWNSSSVEQYCKALEDGRLPLGGGEHLTEKDIYNERIMLGLRTTRGVPKGLIAAPGILQDTGDTYRIPRDKLFICDSIIEDFLR